MRAIVALHLDERGPERRVHGIWNAIWPYDV